MRAFRPRTVLRALSVLLKLPRLISCVKSFELQSRAEAFVTLSVSSFTKSELKVLSVGVSDAKAS